MTHYSIPEIKEKIEKYPKIDLIHLPTPFKKLENLSQALGGPEIFIKRDDLTGLALGGNKSRKLEYILKDVLNKKADVIITWASLQSNWCMQTATAARKFGIKPILILFKNYDLPDEYDGNLLLDLILDADIRIMDVEKGKPVCDEIADEIMKGVENEVKEQGHTPYVAPIGGSVVGGSMEYPLGAISYVKAFAEMLEQAQKENKEIDYIVHASGSGGTQAGLVVGAKALADNVKVLGISVSEEKESYRKEVHSIAQDTVKALDLDIYVDKKDVIIFDEYIREGYGIIDSEISKIIRFMAKKEGIFLDPVYTGKAMIALLDLVEKGYIKKKNKVVFFHTGGIPALFPNKHKLQEFLK